MASSFLRLRFGLQSWRQRRVSLPSMSPLLADGYRPVTMRSGGCRDIWVRIQPLIRERCQRPRWPMGGCCFTPTKRDFLWWYWLLLASIVGIPMLLAVLYVVPQKERCRGQDQAACRRHRGHDLLAGEPCVLGLVLFFVANKLIDIQFPVPVGESRWIAREAYYTAGYAFLALQFFAAFVAANGVNDLIRKRPWYKRVRCLSSALPSTSFCYPARACCSGVRPST